MRRHEHFVRTHELRVGDVILRGPYAGVVDSIVEHGRQIGDGTIDWFTLRVREMGTTLEAVEMLPYTEAVGPLRADEEVRVIARALPAPASPVPVGDPASLARTVRIFLRDGVLDSGHEDHGWSIANAAAAHGVTREQFLALADEMRQLAPPVPVGGDEVDSIDAAEEAYADGLKEGRSLRDADLVELLTSDVAVRTLAEQYDGDYPRDERVLRMARRDLEAVAARLSSTTKEQGEIKVGQRWAPPGRSAWIVAGVNGGRVNLWHLDTGAKITVSEAELRRDYEPASTTKGGGDA